MASRPRRENETFDEYKKNLKNEETVARYGRRPIPLSRPDVATPPRGVADLLAAVPRMKELFSKVDPPPRIANAEVFNEGSNLRATIREDS